MLLFPNMIVLSFYDDRDDLYLVYRFEQNGLPSKECHVTKRGQGIPSRHRLSIAVDGQNIFEKKRGFVLTKKGRQTQRHLPIQPTSNNHPLVGMTIDAKPVSTALPKKIWKQYDRTRVLFQRLDEYYEARDNQWDCSTTVYIPVRCVLTEK